MVLDIALTSCLSRFSCLTVEVMNNPTEMVVAISLAILGVVFFACVIILIYICRNRFSQHKKLHNYMDFK